jgi:hypothetical protein
MHESRTEQKLHLIVKLQSAYQDAFWNREESGHGIDIGSQTSSIYIQIQLPLAVTPTNEPNKTMVTGRPGKQEKGNSS